MPPVSNAGKEWVSPVNRTKDPEKQNNKIVRPRNKARVHNAGGEQISEQIKELPRNHVRERG